MTACVASMCAVRVPVHAYEFRATIFQASPSYFPRETRLSATHCSRSVYQGSSTPITERRRTIPLELTPTCHNNGCFSSMCLDKLPGAAEGGRGPKLEVGRGAGGGKRE